MPNPKPIFSAVLAFIIITLALVTLSRHEYTWADWKPATCMPEACFCEAIRSGTIAQPANTWSSLGFVLVGFLVFARNVQDTLPSSPLRGLNRMAASRAYAFTYGSALVLIGLGSAFYHASLTFAGQFCDVMGMYLLACFILLYNISGLGSNRFVVLYVAMNLILAVFLIVLPELRRYLFAALILIALLLAYLPRRAPSARAKSSYLLRAFLTIVVAFIIFLFDLTKVVCQPTSWLQGHALWHLGGALSAGMLYQHYRTEN